MYWDDGDGMDLACWFVTLESLEQSCMTESLCLLVRHIWRSRELRFQQSHGPMVNSHWRLYCRTSGQAFPFIPLLKDILHEADAQITIRRVSPLLVLFPLLSVLLGRITRERDGLSLSTCQLHS